MVLDFLKSITIDLNGLSTKFGTIFSKPKNLVLRYHQVWYQVFPHPKTWCLGTTKFGTKFQKLGALGTNKFVTKF